MFDAPPQAEVGSAEDCYLNESDRYASFMIFLRMVWNLLAFFTKGLVKKSAMLSSVRTNGTYLDLKAQHVVSRT